MTYQLELPLSTEDGPLYCPEVGEYTIIIDGNLTGLWAEDEDKANKMYIEQLKTRRKHVQRNEANRGDYLDWLDGPIPFNGEPVGLPEDDNGNGLAIHIDY